MEITEYRGFIETVDYDDPLVFWRENSARFPLLSNCARRLLCCPATSIKSEQLFSSCTQFANQTTRSRLGLKKVEEQLLVKANRNFITRYWNGQNTNKTCYYFSASIVLIQRRATGTHLLNSLTQMKTNNPFQYLIIR